MILKGQVTRKNRNGGNFGVMEEQDDPTSQYSITPFLSALVFPVTDVKEILCKPGLVKNINSRSIS